jgi:hypothetical protein
MMTVTWTQWQHPGSTPIFFCFNPLQYCWKAEDLSFLHVLLVWGVNMASLLNNHHLPVLILGFFWPKKNLKCSLPATNHPNTSLFRLPSNEMTLMRMVAIVATCPIWLLCLAKLDGSLFIPYLSDPPFWLIREKHLPDL